MPRLPFWLSFTLALVASAITCALAVDLIPSTPPLWGKLAAFGTLMLMWVNTTLGNPIKPAAAKAQVVADDVPPVGDIKSAGGGR